MTRCSIQEACQIEEGRINLQTGKHEYSIRDHLGNPRVYFTVNDANTADVLQEAHYYPFGLPIHNLSYSNELPTNHYQYNGKELNPDFGLHWNDYGARWYDAQIGKWLAVDPLAEKYYAWSGYNYVMDNPLKFIDPDGRRLELVNSTKKEQKELEKIINKGLGNKYTAKFDKNTGELQLTSNSDDSLTDSEKALFDVLEESINSESTVKLETVDGSGREEVFIDQANDDVQKLDLEDIKSIDKLSDGKVSAQGMLGHAVKEAYEIQVEKNPHDANGGTAHTEGFDVQSLIDGYNIDDTVIETSMGTITGAKYFIKENNGKLGIIRFKINKRNPQSVIIDN